MSRDYKKPRTRSRSRKKKAASPIKFLFGGFALGIIAAATVYYIMAPAPPREPDRPIPAVASVPPSAEAIDDLDEPLETPPPPPAPEPKKDRFKFYELLPNYEVIIAETEERVDDAKPAATTTKPGVYVLQAGSFRRYADADRMKAQLALQGIESTIQEVTIDKDKTYHRVRIGPETELKRVNDLRTRLREQDIDALLIRVAE